MTQNLTGVIPTREKRATHLREEEEELTLLHTTAQRKILSLNCVCVCVCGGGTIRGVVGII